MNKILDFLWFFAQSVLLAVIVVAWVYALIVLFIVLSFI